MPIHPALVAFLERGKSLPPAHTLPIDVARQRMGLMRALSPPPPAVGHVGDRGIPGPGAPIPVRLYTPFGIGPFPITAYIHGGGFCMGDLDIYDALCRHLCLASGAVVMSVGYRLSPEHKFPAGSDDCLAATRWAAEHAGEIGADARRIAIAGDSAGGNLAAVTAIRIRDEGGPKLCGQLLNCPVVDLAGDTPSLRENAGILLTRELMDLVSEYYLPASSDKTHPLASPLRAESLAGLPPAYVLTAQYDPLRDEGEAYADKLAQAGVPVLRKRYSNMIHDFPMMLGIVPEAAEELAAFGAWLKARFAAA